MLRSWPLGSRLSNQNHKGGHAKGIHHKKWCDAKVNELCGAKGSEVGVPPLVFGGEGCQPVLHIDKGNAT
eukprot:12326949-Ditylum_brightwellii.AAC.1